MDVRKVSLKGGNIPRPRSSPTVDRLIRISRRAQIGMNLRHRMHDVILSKIRILILVDQNKAEVMVQLLADVWLIVHQPHDMQQQIVEVDSVLLPDASFVEREDLIDDGIQRISRTLLKLLPKLFGGDHFIASTTDAPQNSPGLMKHSVQLVILHDLADDGDLIGMIEDREVILQSHMFGKSPQNPGAETMEGADADSQPAQQLFDSLLHLASRLVGKRQRENVFRRDAAFQQSSDPMRDHSGFAGTRPGQHHQGPFEMLHRFVLCVGEI